MSKHILMIASNYGLWAEELQAPWDALKAAGHTLVLATYKGKTPLPIDISVNPGFIDPLQNYPVNPPEVVSRVNAILDSGEWSSPIRVADAKMSDYDAIVLVGGPGAPLDITGNPKVHALLLEAYKTGKLIGAMCYAVAALAFTRDPDNGNKSIIYGHRVTAHPHEWDFDFDVTYGLVRTTEDNAGTDLVTPGFVFPLQFMIEDAVGPQGQVLADPTSNREKPCFVYDEPFVSALSVEAAIAFGKLLVEVLSSRR